MLILSLPIRPLSLNSAYIVHRGYRVPSPQYTQFKRELHAMLKPHHGDIMAFFSCFNPKSDEIHASLTFHTPDLYTARGTINQKCGDVDNMHKLLGDQIFSLQDRVDDSAIVSLVLRKTYAKEYLTVVKYEIVSRVDKDQLSNTVQ